MADAVDQADDKICSSASSAASAEAVGEVQPGQEVTMATEPVAPPVEDTSPCREGARHLDASPESSAQTAPDFSTVLCGVASALRDAHERVLAPIMAENAQLKRENAYMSSRLGMSGAESGLRVCQGSEMIREVQRMPEVPSWRPSVSLAVPDSSVCSDDLDACSELGSEPGAAAGDSNQESALALTQNTFSAGADQCRLSAAGIEPPCVLGVDRNCLPLAAKNANLNSLAPKSMSLESPNNPNRLSTMSCGPTTPQNRLSVMSADGEKMSRLSVMSLDQPKTRSSSRQSAAHSRKSDSSLFLSGNASFLVSPHMAGVLDPSPSLLPGLLSEGLLLSEGICEGHGESANGSSQTPRGSTVSNSNQPSHSMEQFIAQEIEDRVKLSSAMNLTVGKLYSIVFHAWAYHADRMKVKLAFRPHPVWETQVEGGEHKHSLVDHIAIHKSTSQISKRLHDSKTMHLLPNHGSCAPNFILFPNSPVRMAWDLFGALLLGFDIIMIPLSAFTDERNWFTIFMDWFALIFWTGDIAMSCRTGFSAEGQTILNPRQILIHYCRTWFVLDLIVVVPDWVFTVTELASADGRSSRGDRGSKLLRALRVVRMSRVLRLVKLNRVMAVIRDRIDSEFLFIIVNIVKLILLLLVVNHFLASVWYAIGVLGVDLKAKNWVQAHDFQGQPLGERYTVALHWTLTQFTPASMDVQPQNTGERSFAITVLVCGLVLFSSFISSITNSMTQLRSMDDDRSKQFWLLRRYLRHYNIQASLAFRILRHVEFSCNETREIIPENKIWVLGLLSEQLRSELKFCVSYSCMSTHPLFDCITEVSRMTMVQLCSKALSIKNLAGTDVLFLPGTIHPQMYYVEAGQISYVHVDSTIDCRGEILQPNTSEWICEPALWTQWVTLGDAHAITECKIVSIDSTPFGQVIAKDFLPFSMGSKYAKGYSSWLSTIPRSSLTDLIRSDQSFAIASNVIEEIERLRDFQHSPKSLYQRKKRMSRAASRGFTSLISMKSQISLVSSKSTLSKMTSRVSKIRTAEGRSRVPLLGKLLSSKGSERRSKKSVQKVFSNIAASDS